MRQLATERRNMQPVAQSRSQTSNELISSRDHQIDHQRLEDALEDEDNDEENVVIDMADEDDEDDEEGEENGRQMYQLQHELVAHQSLNNPYLNNNNNYVKASVNKVEDGRTLEQLQIGDTIWFDPNQCGYSIPGKIVDYYPDVNVLTVEGYNQVAANFNPTLEDKQQLTNYSKSLIEADQQLQIYELSDKQQLEANIKLRVPITDERGLADVVDLDELSNESIIWNLKLRYKQELVYTRCGRKILLSVNPFKSVNHLYNLDQVSKYDSCITSNSTRLRVHPLYVDSDTQQREDAHLFRWLLLHDTNEQTASSNQNSLDPHLFEMANEALEQMLISGKDQCFILLGESGSGKTEVCKLLVQYLATINKSPSNLIQEQILESIQVLESFGNAKTTLNDNSSRFGRLLSIQFNLANGYMQSAQTSDLNLLDRSRIVSQIEQERNYHIFYELLAGLSKTEKEAYGLQSAEKYFYLNQGHCVELAGKEDADDFRSLLSSIQVLGFNQEEQDTIFRVLASILHLGNVYFHRKVLAMRSGKLAEQQQKINQDLDLQQQSVGIEGVEIGSDTEVRWVSHLLQIQFDAMMRCLSVRTTDTYYQSNLSDRIVTPLNIDQALDTRDIIARTLYTCLFKWLLQRINSIVQTDLDLGDETPKKYEAQQPIYLCRTSESLCEFQPDKLTSSIASDSRQSSLSRRVDRMQRAQARRPAEAACLCILDAFGFESLAENNFEQLCINFAAELLSYHTHGYLLRLEQAEYLRERLRWSPISSSSSSANQTNHQAASTGSSAGSTLGRAGSSAAIVNLLSKKPLGILAILDDECNFPKATDQSFAEKCHHNHTLNENYQRARLSSNCQEFGIRHFKQASRLVWYQVDGFIEKNRDSLRPDIMELLLGSKVSIVADMLRKLHPHEVGPAGQQQPKTLSRTYDGRFVSMKPRLTSVAARFQDTLANNRCLEALNCSPAAETPLSSSPTNPWFIICLRPNRAKSSQVFDVAHVQDQVRCLHLLELAQMRRSGYPVKLRYADLLRAYSCLAPRRFFEAQQQVGSTKVADQRRTVKDICRALLDFRLSLSKSSLETSSQTDQVERPLYQCGLTKVFLNERLYNDLEHQRLLVYRQAILLIQRQMRMWPVRSRFLLQRRAATLIQAYVRRHQAQRNFWRTYELIVLLQRYWRKFLFRRQRQALAAKREERRLNQLRILQEMQTSQKNNQFRHRIVQTNNQALQRPQLDIPDSLAQLYRAQRDQKPVHELSQLVELDLEHLWSFERQRKGDRVRAADQPPVVANAIVPPVDPTDNCDEDSDEEQYSLHNLVLNYYSSESPSFGYSRLSISRPFSWPQISRRRRAALKRVPRAQDAQVAAYFSNLVHDSTAIYKLLLRYIDSDLATQSIDSTKTEQVNKFKLITDYVIYLCLRKPLLRDELYLQLLSLSWQNPRLKSKENVWKLLVNCLCCFEPKDRQLLSYMKQYALVDCPDRYKKLVLLNIAHHQQRQSEKKSETSKRSFPPSLLEYWANQQSVANLGLSATCHMDVYKQVEASEHASTVVQIDSRTNAQSVAAAVLRARNVSEHNLVGWSLEIEHVESSQAFQVDACRLRGDDIVLDHLSRLELLPDFVDLLEQDQDCFNSKQVRPKQSSKGRKKAAVAGELSEGLLRKAPMVRMPSDLGPNAVRARYSSDMDLARSSSRLSQTSRLNRRYLATQLAGDNNPSSSMMRHEDYHQANGYHEQEFAMSHADDRRLMSSLNRRSMSMQELQLASSSLLNGRYFNQMQSPKASESSHYASSYVHQIAANRNSRNSAGSLQQLSNQAGNYHSHQQMQHPQQRRRSQTPNSMHLQRFSSSAYGTGSSAYLAYDRARAEQERSASPGASMPRRRLSARLDQAPLSGPPIRDESLYRRHRSSGSGSITSSQPAFKAQMDYNRGPPTLNQPLRHAAPSKPMPKRPIYAEPGSHYVASSALSDTSDAVSLASHVRAVKAPQSNGDLDRYLDDLFQPMLDGADLDELSDARSLATSIRGHLQIDDQLASLSDPIALTKMIRGTEPSSPIEGEQAKQESAEVADRETLSPTFESLLQSLKDYGHVQSEGVDTSLSATASDQIGPSSSLGQLSNLNLEELKALNERLESQIQAAQSKRPGLGHLSYNADELASAEEVYQSRAKTIRIGKWRWPPPADEMEPGIQPDQVSEATELYPAEPPPPQQPPVAVVVQESSAQNAANPGKIKISSEMKAKLEQLTTGSSTSTSAPPPPPPPAPPTSSSSLVLQAKNLLDHQRAEQAPVRKLAETRRNLLENQLSGGLQRDKAPPSPIGDDESLVGGKVMFAKQQLAAAAGVALAALDSGSQAGSRRQSTQLGGEAATETSGAERRSRVLQDELGPQSRAAITQRLAFYQQSSEPSGVTEPPVVRPDPNADKPVQKLSTIVSEPEQIYGRSVAKSLSQRQHEALRSEPAAKQAQLDQQWVSSSPDLSPSKRPAVPKSHTSSPKVKLEPRQDEPVEDETKQSSTACYLYGGVHWQVKVRKEFFLPSETYDEPLVLQLLFGQLVADVFNPHHWTRLNTKERATLKALMKDNSIGYAPSLAPIGELDNVKRELVRMARAFGLYFSRPYAAKNFAHCADEGPSRYPAGLSDDEEPYRSTSANESSSDESQLEQKPTGRGSQAAKLASRLQRADNLGSAWLDLVAVHHSGLRLVCLASAGAQQQPAYKVIETLKYRDMTDVSLVGPNELLVSMRNGKKCWIFSSFEAKQLCSLLSRFHTDYNDHTSKESAGRDPVSSKARSTLEENLLLQKPRGTKGSQARGRNNKRSENKDALLAADDDHHGDHFKQRQAPDSLKQLHKAPNTYNDLVDRERALPSDLADAHQTDARQQLAPSDPQATGAPSSAACGSLELAERLIGASESSSPSAPARESADQIETTPTSTTTTSKKKKKSSKKTDSKSKLEAISGKSEDSSNNTGSQSSRASQVKDGYQEPRSISESMAAGSKQTTGKQMQVHLDGWVETLAEPDQECADKQPQLDNQPAISLQSQQQDHELEPSSTPYEATRQVANHDDGKYSLLQFALYNFREAIDKYSLESRATKLGPQMDVGDTSTLRGSLKLIESLRGSHSAQQSAETNKSAKTASGASSGQFEPSSVKGRHRRGPPEWTWRELAEMVKFTPSPIRQSLLRLPTDDLNRRALDCFQAIMAYMGDLESAGSQAGSGSQSKSSQLSCKPMGEVECVYLILMNCHNYPILRDEIYCQLMKQTTNNRSSNPDSCLRGWRLFSIVAAYFDCSDHFRPYLLNYLETAAYDKRRAYCSVALLCLQNLRKTLKYLGRKNVPSIEEIAATSAGRNSKRQIYRLPGGTERVINTKSTTVVDDIIHEICTNMLNISEPDEMLEFSLYCIADGDLYTMPLNRDEYILDITTELIKNHQQYFLIFCRSIWHFPLRLESKLYIEVIFNQIAPDYLEGLLLVLPGLGRAGSRLSGMPEQPLRLKTKLVKEVARIGALLHRASGTDYMPHKDEVKYLLPKPIISSMKQLQRRSQDQSCSSASSSSANSDRRRSGDENLQSLKLGVDAKLDTVVTSPQKWIELVQSNWREMSAFDTLDAKAQFLDIIRHWPLFGSSFFAIKLIQRDLIQPTDFILALNKFGIQMLDTVSHETIHRYPFNEVISTRKVRSEDGALYLDLKCGNLMKRTIIRIQTDQAHEISRLTRQYIDIELIQQQKQQHGQAGRAQTDSARLSAQYSVAGSSNEGISDQ